MLPRRKPKAPKRSTRWRSQKHLNWIRGFVCAMDGPICDGETQAAHVRLSSGAGMGQKPDDWRAVPLCRACHLERQHRQGEPQFWADYESLHEQSVWQLIDELCKASPCAAEIRKAREQ